MGLDLAGTAGDDVYVVAPVSGMLAKASMASLLNASDAERDSAGTPLEQIVVLNLPPSSFVKLDPTNSNVLPTDVVVQKVGTQGNALFIPLAGTDQIQKRSPSTLALLASRTLIPAVNSHLVVPNAVAARTNGDFVFTANPGDGSVSRVISGTATPQLSVSVGSGTARVAIQPEVTSNQGLALEIAEMTGAPDSAFDSPAHRRSLLAQLRSVANLIAAGNASVQSVQTRVSGVVSKVDAWVVDPGLAASARVNLSDVLDLYVREHQTHEKSQ